jgi:hypothetical protein
MGGIHPEKIPVLRSTGRLRSLDCHCVGGQGDDREDTAACPPQIQEQVKVAASAAAITTLANLAPADPSSNAVAGRRVVISLSPGAAAAGLHLVSNTITITTFGGTFEGMAGANEDAGGTTNRAHEGTGAPGGPHVTQISDTRAIEVTPGRLRIAPFIVGTALRPQTFSMDLLVIPGEVPWMRW